MWAPATAGEWENKESINKRRGGELTPPLSLQITLGSRAGMKLLSGGAGPGLGGRTGQMPAHSSAPWAGTWPGLGMLRREAGS